MKQDEYRALEAYMISSMKDSAHDREHIYRVLYTALDIADHQPPVDTDVLIAACLLHDIARDLQAANPSVCHAQAGGEMARAFLLERGWSSRAADHVRDCIHTHRFRSDHPPVTLEAKLLFDADKLEAAGALGIARTILYSGSHDRVLYTVRDGQVEAGEAAPSSFVREYNFKLVKIYDGFYTEYATELALGRRQTAEAFYQGLLQEVNLARSVGLPLLSQSLTD